MGVSVSVNTSHIAYGQNYTIDYECTYTPFNIDISLVINDSSSARMKYVAENLTSEWGNVTFSVSVSEVIAEMERRGYPYPENKPSGITVSVVPQDLDEIFNGNYAESELITVEQPATKCGAPTSPTVDKTVSRDAVALSWGAGSAGTNNAVTGYDVQYQDSADGRTWPSNWTTASGSPVTAENMSVSPPTAVGYYRRFRVRTRGSAGSEYYSDWVISENVLRRKWNAFGAWTDPTLSVGGDLRSVHMTEMQERIKTIRSFYGLSAAAFTTITGSVTLAADWTDHISEIRTAIDGITTDHAAWITATAGEPAIAVMNQLRNIIDSL